MTVSSQTFSDIMGLAPWIATLAAIALAVVGVNLLLRLLLHRAGRAVGRTATVWDEALVTSGRGPLLALVWIIGLGYMAHVVQRQVEVEFVPVALAVRDMLIIVCVTWFLVRFVGRAGRNIVAARQQRGEAIDATTADALVKLVRLVVVVVAVLVAAQTLGFQIAGLLALGGIGGIAVGFAAKDLVANFFGGLTIYLDRPFGVGDLIRSPDRNIEGTVESISWRHTRVRTSDKTLLFVPNSLFTTIVLENPSRMTNRRIRETVSVRYEDFAAVEAIVADIRAMLEGHAAIDADVGVSVGFVRFGPSAIEILCDAFTRTVVWREYLVAKQDVLLQIGRIVERQGAEIALPTQTLQLRQDPAAAAESSSAA